MTLRMKMVISATMATALVLTAAAIVLYNLIRYEARGRVVTLLREQASALAPEMRRVPLDASKLADLSNAVPVMVDAEIVTAQGRVYHVGQGGLTLPPIDKAAAVAAGRAGPYVSEVDLRAADMLSTTTRLGGGRALVVGEPLAPTDSFMRHVGDALSATVLAGSILSAMIAAGAVTRSFRPLDRLAQAVSEVASTKDLSRRLEVRGDDEASQLARDFNTMLGALERAVEAQRQLVADASHELRTPLTSLRTNLEVLLASPDMGSVDRLSLGADVLSQIEELGVLVTDLADLARDEPPVPVASVVDLAALVQAVVQRVGRANPGRSLAVALEPIWILGDEGLVARAVTNLLDNAFSWGPPGEEVAVSLTLDNGEALVEVRDHGPGIPPEDLPFIFDRFYRSKGARRMPGSGLGLAIVRQIALWHGGSTGAGTAQGGGAIVWIRLPALSDETISGAHIAP